MKQLVRKMKLPKLSRNGISKIIKLLVVERPNGKIYCEVTGKRIV